MATKIKGENRRRNNRIVFYVTDEELELINEKYSKTNCTSKGDFIRNNILNNIIVVNDFTYLKKLILEVNRIGTNINQIAKIANTDLRIHREQLNKIYSSLNKVWDLIYEGF